MTASICSDQLSRWLNPLLLFDPSQFIPTFLRALSYSETHTGVRHIQYTNLLIINIFNICFIHLLISLLILFLIVLPIVLSIVLAIVLPSALPSALPIAYCVAPYWCRLVLSDAVSSRTIANSPSGPAPAQLPIPWQKKEEQHTKNSNTKAIQ